MQRSLKESTATWKVIGNTAPMSMVVGSPGDWDSWAQGKEALAPMSPGVPLPGEAQALAMLNTGTAADEQLHGHAGDARVLAREHEIKVGHERL